MAEPSTRVLLVEDDTLLSNAIVRAMTQAGFAIDVAATCAEAEERISTASYRLVVLDLHLPDGDGAGLVDVASRRQPPPMVAVLSGFVDSQVAIDLHGRVEIVIPKPVDARTLATVAVRLTDREGTDSLLEAFCAHHRLSRRESELLGLAADGVDNATAASRLSCKAATITTYWRRIFDKTGCRSQRDVIAAVLRFETPTVR